MITGACVTGAVLETADARAVPEGSAFPFALPRRSRVPGSVAAHFHAVRRPRRGGGFAVPEPRATRGDALAVLESASVRTRIAVGRIAGRKMLRLQGPGAVGTATQVTKRLTTTHDGFSLNLAVVCRVGKREKPERLCRHVAPSPLALERLDYDGDGLVVNRLRRPFHNGTTEFLFEPFDFLARLRSHLLRYHGVPDARHRRLVVPAPAPKPAARDDKVAPALKRPSMNWKQPPALRA